MKLDNSNNPALIQSAAAAQQADLQAQLEAKDMALLAMHRKQESLNSTISDLRAQIESKDLDLNSYQQQLRHAASNDDEQQQQQAGDSFVLNMSSVVPDSSSKTDALLRGLATPSPGHHSLNSSTQQRQQQQQVPRSMLKVYMSNQLDLNESEMEYYETVVNDLAARLEALQAEKAQLTEDCKEAQDEAERLRSMLQQGQRQHGHGQQRDISSPERHGLTSALGLSRSADSEEDEENEQGDRPSTAASGLGASGGKGAGRDGQSSSFSLGSHFGSIDLGSSSFHSTSEHVFSGSSIDELRAMLSEREQQMKVHISHLQAQQDSLHELKHVIGLLKEQKNGLRGALTDANETIEGLKQRELEALNRVNQLQGMLENEQLHSEEMKLMLQDSEARSGELQHLVDDLMAKTKAYRLQIEDQQQYQGTPQQQQQQQARMVDRTPVRQSESSRNLRNASSSSASISGSDPRSNRLAMAESQVDELTAQLRMSERAREDLQLEHDKAQVRLQAKTRNCEEQAKELHHLRHELDTQLAEIDRLKIAEMKFDANTKLLQIDNESEIEILQGRVKVLDAEVEELRGLLRGKEDELEAELEANRSLREVLQKFGEKDDTTEGLLSQLRADREAAAAQLSDVSAQLTGKAQKLGEAQRRCDELQGLLRERTHEKEGLDQTVASLRGQLEAVQGGARGDLDALHARLRQLGGEKEQAAEALRAQQQRVEEAQRELTERTSELVICQRALGDVAETVRYYDARLRSFEETLMGRVEAQLAGLGGRLDAAQWALRRVTEDVVDRADGAIKTKSMVRLDALSVLATYAQCAVVSRFDIIYSLTKLL